MQDPNSNVRFNKQLTRSIYILGVFTPNDFITLIICLCVNVLIVNSNICMILTLTGYPIYLALFRLGRNPGYDVHYFKSLFYSKNMRPGRSYPKD
jgi:hypothetical protein